MPRRSACPHTAAMTSAVYLCAEAGMSPAVLENDASHNQRLTKLRSDNRMISVAAAQARKAADCTELRSAAEYHSSLPDGLPRRGIGNPEINLPLYIVLTPRGVTSGHVPRSAGPCLLLANSIDYACLHDNTIARKLPAPGSESDCVRGRAEAGN
jgi:hypothetical protein